MRPLVLGGGAAALLVAFALVVFGGGASKASAFATLDVLEKTVSVRPQDGAKFHDGRKGESLKAGATVRTGSKGLASITYFDDSLTRIGPNASYHLVTLQRPDGGKVIVGRIDVGEAFHDVKEVTGSTSRFEVNISQAVAAVRGTKFASRCVKPLPCGIAVVKGVVVVKGKDGKSRTVRAGQRVTIDDEGTLSNLLLISADDAWINRNLQLELQSSSSGASSTTSGPASSTTSVVPPGSSTSQTTTVVPPTTAAGSVTTVRTPTTVRAATTTTRKGVTTTKAPGTTAKPSTTQTTVPTTQTTVPPTTQTTQPTTTQTTARPTTTTTRPTTTTREPEPTDVSYPGPGPRSSSTGLPWAWLFAAAGGVTWIRRHSGEYRG